MLNQSYEIVSTDMLKTGDLVAHYGFIFRLGEVRTSTSSSRPGETVYAFKTEVVAKPTYETVMSSRVAAGWIVQGNRFACWTRLIESPFMAFWRVVNHQRAMDQKPEALFAEARDLWAQYEVAA